MRTLDSTVFYTNNLPEIVEFYSDVIGLELEYRQGDAYASFVFGNGVRLGIKQAVEAREIPGSQTIILNIEDAEAEYQQAKEKGLDIHHKLSDDPWGKWFSVFDLDKNLIEFLQRK